MGKIPDGSVSAPWAHVWSGYRKDHHNFNINARVSDINRAQSSKVLKCLITHPGILHVLREGTLISISEENVYFHDLKKSVCCLYKKIQIYILVPLLISYIRTSEKF